MPTIYKWEIFFSPTEIEERFAVTLEKEMKLFDVEYARRKDALKKNDTLISV